MTTRELINHLEYLIKSEKISGNSAVCIRQYSTEPIKGGEDAYQFKDSPFLIEEWIRDLEDNNLIVEGIEKLDGHYKTLIINTL
jgi:hypothetical protein